MHSFFGEVLCNNVFYKFSMMSHQILDVLENMKIFKSPKYKSVSSKYVLYRDKPAVFPSPNPQATPRVTKRNCYKGKTFFHALIIVTVYIQFIILHKVSNLSPASLLIFLLRGQKSKRTHTYQYLSLVRRSKLKRHCKTKSTAYQKNLDKASIMHCKKKNTRHSFSQKRLQNPSTD